ncbi:MAG: phosphotriesterase-related protein [Treponema sp.]|nr:phosphotriesterase-related protein [Treponema sp.]
MTYMHEHLRIDLSAEKNDPDCLLDEFDLVRDELSSLSENGLKRIVDMSCRGMGRNYEYIDRMEKAAGINVVISTGFYKDPFMPPAVNTSSVEELAALMIDDIQNGAEKSSRRAQIIGEIGTSENRITANEEKVFRAAAAAHEKTGVPVSTHTTLGTLGREQIILLKALGVDPSKTIIGHLALANDINLILKALDAGVYVEFDTIGKNKYLPDETRIDFIKTCCEKGYAKQLLLSMDITRKSHLKANGGIGYAYLLDSFLPRLLEAGVRQAAVDDMLINNPDRIFSEVK